MEKLCCFYCANLLSTPRGCFWGRNVSSRNFRFYDKFADSRSNLLIPLSLTLVAHLQSSLNSIQPKPLNRMHKIRVNAFMFLSEFRCFETLSLCVVKNQFHLIYEKAHFAFFHLCGFLLFSFRKVEFLIFLSKIFFSSSTFNCFESFPPHESLQQFSNFREWKCFPNSREQQFS